MARDYASERQEPATPEDAKILEAAKKTRAQSEGVSSDKYSPPPTKPTLSTNQPIKQGLITLKSDLSKGVGSRQSPQAFMDGHSSTLVTGKRNFDRPPRINPRNSEFTFIDRKSGRVSVTNFDDTPGYRQTNFDSLQNLTLFDRAKFSKDTFKDTTISINRDTKSLQEYYDRALKDNDVLGARNNDRLGFDEPFIVRGIGDRWGPGGLGALDAGFVRGGFVTAASRTLADVERLTKYLLTPRGIAFVAKQNLLQAQNWMDTNNQPRQVNLTNPNLSTTLTVGASAIKAALGIPDGEPQRQYYNKGLDRLRRDSKGNIITPGLIGETGPNVALLGGSDIRSWRALSILGSLPPGAHAVRHKIPGGLSEKLLNIGSEYLFQLGDSLVDWMGTATGLATKITGTAITAIPKLLHGAASAYGPWRDAKLSGYIHTDSVSAFVNSPGAPLHLSLGLRIPQLITVPTVFIGDILGGIRDFGKSIANQIKAGLSTNLPSIRISAPKFGGPSLNIGSKVLGAASSVAGFVGNIGKNIAGFIDLDVDFPSLGSLDSIGGKGAYKIQINKSPVKSGVAKYPIHSGFDTRANREVSATKRNELLGSILTYHHSNYYRMYGVAMSTAGTDGLSFSNLGRTFKSDETNNPPTWVTTAQPRYQTDIGFGFLRTKDINLELTSRIINEDKDKAVLLTNYYNSEKPGPLELSNVEDNYEVLIRKTDNFNRNGFPLDDLTYSGIDFAFHYPNTQQHGWRKDDDNIAGRLNVVPIRINKSLKLQKGSLSEDLTKPSADTASPTEEKYQFLTYGQIPSKEDDYAASLDKSPASPGKHQNHGLTRKIGDQGGSARFADDTGNDGIGMIAFDGDKPTYKSNLQDHVNLHPYAGSKIDETDSRQALNDTEVDFIPFKFRDTANGKWIIFRAILESISDTSSPDYAEERYIGRPDKVYVYRGADRNVNITFKVMPKSIQELITLWDKLNFLKGLTYPSIDNKRMITPFFELTLGDMFNKQPMIFQSLNYSIDTQSTWEIQPGLRLPKLIQCSADMRLVDKRLPVATGKHFGLPWLNGDLTHGTFNADPSNPASATPDRQKYKKLWGELKPLGLTPEIATQLNVVGKSYAELKDQELSKIINNFEVDAPFSPEDLISKIG